VLKVFCRLTWEKVVWGSIPACVLTLVLFYDDMFEALHAVHKVFMIRIV